MVLFLSNILILPVALLTLVIVLNRVGKGKSKRLSMKQKTGWLLAHIIFVVIYFGGLLGVCLLAISTIYIEDPKLIYAAHLFIQYFDWFLIIPGGLGSLITGLWLAVRTHWGLGKHYWVVAKWVVNIAAITFGSNFMRFYIHDNFANMFSRDINPLQNPTYLQSRQMLFIGILISVTMLIFLFSISYFKPWGKRKNTEVTT